MVELRPSLLLFPFVRDEKVEQDLYYHSSTVLYPRKIKSGFDLKSMLNFICT